MQASDGLRQTAYVIVMILLSLALFFLLVGDRWTAGILGGVSAVLFGIIEWVRARAFRGFARDNASPRRN
jgi:uncharacterized MnhB-related membrane protein